MHVVLFYTKADQSHAEKWFGMTDRMLELLKSHPGFVDVNYVQLPDGRYLAIGYFENAESIRAWYDNPEHVDVMRQGRDEIFSDYTIEVCEIVRSYTKGTSLFDVLHPA